MARVATDDKHYKAIASAIRSQAPHQDIGDMKPEKMASNINKIAWDNFTAGETEGYRVGLAEGSQTQYDMFWDILQNNGNRRNYWGAFCSWTDEIFKPKYPIIASAGNQSMFYLSTITRVPTIDLSGAAGLSSTFGYAQSLVEIEKIILKDDGSQTFNAPFNGCKALVEVRFEGVIGNSISFQPCTLLSKDSIMHIFGVLSTTASAQTLTLSRAAVDAEFASIDGIEGTATDEWWELVATRPNWTVSLV